MHKNFCCGNNRQLKKPPSQEIRKWLIFKEIFFTPFVNVLAFVNLIPAWKSACEGILHKVIHKNCGKKPKVLSKPGLSRNL